MRSPSSPVLRQIVVRKPRALVIVHSYYLRDTRPRRHATALAASGWAVDVICARDAGEPRRAALDDVQIRRLPARRERGSKMRYVFEYVSFTVMAFFAAAWMSLWHKYDAVYVVGIPNVLVFAAAVPKALGARVVLDMRDPLPEFFMAKYALKERSWLVRALLSEERISSSFADVVLAPHEACARTYERSASPAKIVSVMNAPDPRLFDTADATPRDPADRTMLYAGTVAERYGVDLAVRALARMKNDIKGLRLRIVGDGDIVEPLRALARDEGVADLVSFDGPVPLDRIPAIVRSAWLGVQPNRNDPLMRFNFSTKVLEWARLGLPVVIGATPPIRAAFDPSELMMIEPGDLDALCAAITRAHDDPAELAEMTERARAAAERYRYEDQIAAFLRALEGED
jgi:glycosyltransferase involved in cell wall biosynthesis